MIRTLAKVQCVFFLTILFGCIEYHPYETNLSGIEGHSNSRNISAVQNSLSPTDTIRFAWFGDTQRFYDETQDFVSDVNAKGNIDFVLHGGDITDFGMKAEYIWMEELFEELDMPHICLVGNHDMLGSGETLYREIYGNPDFSFIFNRIKFICLNTNVAESSYDVPNYNFIEQNISDSISNLYDYTIVAMHAAPPGIFQSVFPQETIDFYNSLNPAKNLLFYLYAHSHKITVSDVFNDGTLHFVTDTVKDRVYFLFTLIDGTYSYTIEYY